jgi:hypothetical protein
VVLLACGVGAQEKPAEPPQDQPVELTELNFPRKLLQGGDTVVVYDPQIESWEKHELLKARSAIVLTAAGEKQDVLGVVEYEVQTETDPDTRQALLKNRAVTEIRFPGLPKEKFEKYAAIVRRVLGAQPSVKLSLDFILSYMKEKAAAVPSVNVNLAPPPIFASEEPAILVIFLGEPDFRPVKGTALKFATNTNWDVLQNTADSRYYLLNGEGWISTLDLQKGPWQAVSKLPTDFYNLPADENWSETRKGIPGKVIPVPKVFFTTVPAELILVDGKPTYAPIPGTRLAVVTNSASDLFRHEGDGQFYYLTAGRWFKATALSGPWFTATGSLPEDFKKIPPDHPNAEVLASVPGTEEAEDAVLLAQVPRKATVKRKDVKLAVTYDGDPKFEPIEKTEIHYAVNSPYSIFKVKERYYCCHEAVWFESPSPTGPWAVCDSVPPEIYTIPPSHPKYFVTYVTIYSSTPDEVVVGYTAGYCGMYVSSGVVVYGMGYPIYYPPYWYYTYPPYWYAYGCGARYSWYGGVYYRWGYAYGPYGGAGFYAGYNPYTGTYYRGAAAYGPYGSRYAAQAYNPYTGTYRARAGGSTPYSSWGRGVAIQGNNWVRGGYYSNSQGTLFGAESSSGGKIIGRTDGQGDRGFVGRSQNGDVYAGRDGNVYRKTDDGWQKYDNGTWNPVGGDRPTPKTRDGPQAGTRDLPKTDAGNLPSAGTRDLPRTDTRDLPSAGTRETQRSTPQTYDTMQNLNRDAQYRSRGTQATQQYRSYGGGGYRGGGRGGGGRR